MTPTPERYKEIQQALIDKGYLQAPASGVWGPECSQALKRFQQEQNLPPSGKLDSLSLISLGLGPSREPYRPTAVVNNRPPSSGGLN
jgi:peptidoglycan hydrolase-like protein with peptidoglycan-binding domain